MTTAMQVDVVGSLEDSMDQELHRLKAQAEAERDNSLQEEVR